jgi:hypothetical protein
MAGMIGMYSKTCNDNSVCIFALICFTCLGILIAIFGTGFLIIRFIKLPDNAKSTAVVAATVAVAAVKPKVTLPPHPVNLFAPPGFPPPVYNRQGNTPSGVPLYVPYGVPQHKLPVYSA